MSSLRDPAVSIVVVILIGILCGWLVATFLRRSWISEKLSGATHGLLTHILVGIAGAFLGFHAAMLAGAAALGSQVLVPFVAAAVVSALVLWGWRSVRV